MIFISKVSLKKHIADRRLKNKMINKSNEKMIKRNGSWWPIEIEINKKVKNSLGFLENIYLMEPADNGALWVTTSYFSRFDRKFEIHTCYLVDRKNIKTEMICKRELSKKLYSFSKKEIKENFGERSYQFN